MGGFCRCGIAGEIEECWDLQLWWAVWCMATELVRFVGLLKY